MSYRFMSDSSFALTKICIFSAFLVEEPAWLQGWDSMVESECRACPPGRFSMQIPKGFEGDTAICRLEPQFFFVGTDVCSKKNFNHLTCRMLSYLSFTIFQLKQILHSVLLIKPSQAGFILHSLTVQHCFPETKKCFSRGLG